MSFPLEKILNLSVQDYFNDYPWDKYDAVGVHLQGEISWGDNAAIKKFAETVPKEAEVVLNYQFSITRIGNYNSSIVYINMDGIALVPKKEE